MDEKYFGRIEKINEFYEFLEVNDPETTHVDDELIMDPVKAQLTAARKINQFIRIIPERFSVYDLQDYRELFMESIQKNLENLNESIQKDHENPNNYARQLKRDELYFGNKATISRRSNKDMYKVLREITTIDNLEILLSKISKNAFPKFNDTFIRNNSLLNSMYSHLDKDYDLSDVLELRRQIVIKNYNYKGDESRYSKSIDQLEFQFSYEPRIEVKKGLEVLAEIIQKSRIKLSKADSIPSYPDVTKEIPVIYIGNTKDEEKEIRRFIRGAVMSHPVFQKHSLDLMNGNNSIDGNDDMVEKITQEVCEDQGILEIARQKLITYLRSD